MKKTWIVVLGVLLLLFIWSQSVAPVAQSAKESRWLTENIINPILHRVGLDVVEDRVVRKMAHVTEFFLLSVVVAQLWGGNVLRTVYTGFTVAFLDESIQLLSKRGALIADVWIDMIGVTLGTLVGCLLWGLVQWRKRRKNERRSRRGRREE